MLTVRSFTPAGHHERLSDPVQHGADRRRGHIRFRPRIHILARGGTDFVHPACRELEEDEEMNPTRKFQMVTAVKFVYLQEIYLKGFLCCIR